MIRLIFDENLSPSLKYALRDIYPQSLHVFDIGLDEVDDPAIWEYAKDVGYIIVTKDSDFLELSDRLGHPPKVVRLKCGNCPTSEVEALLREEYGKLRALYRNEQKGNAQIG